MRCPQIWAGVEEGCAPLERGGAEPSGKGRAPPFAKKGRLACVQAA